jgi:hypothetical protein
LDLIAASKSKGPYFFHSSSKTDGSDLKIFCNYDSMISAPVAITTTGVAGAAGAAGVALGAGAELPPIPTTTPMIAPMTTKAITIMIILFLPPPTPDSTSDVSSSILTSATL